MIDMIIIHVDAIDHCYIMCSVLRNKDTPFPFGHVEFHNPEDGEMVIL